MDNKEYQFYFGESKTPELIYATSLRSATIVVLYARHLQALDDKIQKIVDEDGNTYEVTIDIKFKAI